MKILLSLLLLVPLLSSAFEIELAWDPNSEPDLSGYNLHSKTGDPESVTSGYEQILTVGLVDTATVDLPAGTHDLVITAFNDKGLESLPSDPLIILIDDQGNSTTLGRPGRPGGIRMKKFKWWWARF